MIDEARRAIEREARLRSNRITEQALRWRRLRGASFVTFFASGIVAYLVLFASERAQSAYPSYARFIHSGGIVCAAALLVACQVLRLSARQTARIVGWARLITEPIRRHLRHDFLAAHFVAALLLVWLPFGVTLAAGGLGIGTWIRPGSLLFKSTEDLRALTMAFAGALLGAQLTLFTFVLGNLIGRFSGDLAETLVHHRAVVSLVLFSLFILAATGFASTFGYPEGVVGWARVWLILLFICLLLSVLVTARGIATERAVRYVGFRFAKKIRRIVYSPIAKFDQRPGRLWRAMAWCGFDFRDPARADLSGVPARASRAILLVRPLFNVLNQATRDGQHEVFDAGLEAIYLLMSAYTERRRLYFGSEDPIFSFLNDHFAGILSATSKENNQYLITDVTEYVGAVGRLALKVAPYPRGDSDERTVTVHSSHDLVVPWFRLLQESFQLSQALMRSTAATTALIEARSLAATALQGGYVDVVNYTHLPTVENIHATCCKRADAYPTYLAAECIRGTLQLWAFSFAVDKSDLRIHEAMINAIKAMFEAQMNRPRQLMDPSEPISLLTAKTTEQVPILQDIWFVAFSFPSDLDTARIRISQALDLLELLPTWVRRATETRQILIQYLIQAFYEMAYGAMRSLDALASRTKEEVIDNIFDCCDELLDFLAQPGRERVFDWEHYLFSVIGCVMPRCRRDSESKLKNRVRGSLLKFVIILQTRRNNADDRVPIELYDYLQLVGAWAAAFLSDDDLAGIIATMLADFYPRRDPFYGSSEPFGSLGYPTIHHGDFFLPNLMNIRIHVNQDQWKEFQKAQAEVMADEVLVPYANKIQALASESTET
jgi:hypothetical protein